MKIRLIDCRNSIYYKKQSLKRNSIHKNPTSLDTGHKISAHFALPPGRFHTSIIIIRAISSTCFDIISHPLQYIKKNPSPSLALSLFPYKQDIKYGFIPGTWRGVTPWPVKPTGFILGDKNGQQYAGTYHWSFRGKGAFDKKSETSHCKNDLSPPSGEGEKSAIFLSALLRQPLLVQPRKMPL